MPQDNRNGSVMRKTFNQEIQDIKDDVLLLGSMVENAVMEAARSLRDNDVDHSRLVLRYCMEIARRRFEIEISIMVLIATQQPIARDLRVLAASLDICTELGRIGEYARGMAVINTRSQGLSMPGILRDIYAMSVQGVDMLHRALTTFAEENAVSARLVIDSDDEIDMSYRQLYASAVDKALTDPRTIERVNYVIWVAHNLERLGDRATNICERVIFVVTGERIPEAVAL
jgi:phosphate transport system protein